MIFLQEEHWKIEPLNQVEELEEEELKDEEEEEIEINEESDHESEWEPNPMAIENPTQYREDTWKSTCLGTDWLYS